MRMLKFVAQGQTLKPDQSCSFSGLYAGTIGYLHAAFQLDGDWNGCKIAVSFWRGHSDEEYAVPLRDGMCEIPAEVLGGKLFGISLMGVKPGYLIRTNKVFVRQEVE